MNKQQRTQKKEKDEEIIQKSNEMEINK